MTKRFPWNEVEEKRLRDAYLMPDTTAKDIARDFGLTRDQIDNRIRKLGLSKPRKPVAHVQVDAVGDAIAFLIAGYRKTIVWIDNSRVAWFNERRWHSVGPRSSDRVYVAENSSDMLLHRSLLAARNTEEVDHRDRNTLNNRISNLRIATHQQNTFNSRPPLTTQSGFKGVWIHEHGLYGAMITIDGKKRRIGYYKTARQAARVHDAAARILRGDFAYLNLPDDPMSNDEIAANKTLMRVVWHRVRAA